MPNITMPMTETDRIALREEWMRLYSSGIGSVPVIEAESMPTPSKLFLAPLTKEAATQDATKGNEHA